MIEANQTVKLEKNDQEFFDYLTFVALRSNNALPPDGEEHIKKIVSTEIRANELEDLYTKVINKELATDAYNAVYDKYLKELEASVKNESKNESATSETETPTITPVQEIAPVITPAPIPTPAPTKAVEIVPTPEPKKELSDNSKKIIEYFNLEIKRSNSSLDDKEKEKLENIRKEVQKVRTLEEAHRRVDKREIPTQVLKTIREKYKKEIIDEINTLGLDEKEIMPDDSIIYTKLEEISKKEAPATVTKSTLSDIKPIVNIKEQNKVIEEPKEEKTENVSNEIENNNLHDQIVKSQEIKKEHQIESEENNRLREEIERLKVKIDYLRDEINSLKNSNHSSDELPVEFVELAKYFQLDLKRSKSEISDDELIELRNLTRGSNKMIDDIEDIVRMKANGELTIKEYNEQHDEVYNKYKKMLEERYKEVKKSKTL
jgi:hypothetical protein